MRRALVAAVLGAALAAPGAQAQDEWQPDVSAATAYAKQRQGVEAFAVSTPARYWGWHGGRRFHSASVLKAMLLVAYLRRPAVRDRPLSGDERRLLAPMIRRSANAPASALVVRLGTRRLSRFARNVGMRRFTPVGGVWGHSLITAQDQARFFLRIDRLVPRRHRAYALRLLAGITPSQRWGLARVTPAGWELHFKGGWGTGTGLVDHQVALLTRGDERVSVAVLTARNPGHSYGKQTLRGIGRRLLRAL